MLGSSVYTRYMLKARYVVTDDMLWGEWAMNHDAVILCVEDERITMLYAGECEQRLNHAIAAQRYVGDIDMRRSIFMAEEGEQREDGYLLNPCG
ncbi:hypothetical protein NPIL_490701 [Nephila pilipes]|uniref:Uncharacterized protein n=1 Tax=Nephila pilipes TaxID=299642 RepID=A0A8X6PZL6_NEPPI|nr:hypothetical protein NPIL_490701 [Nephila pilipes]